MITLRLNTGHNIARNRIQSNCLQHLTHATPGSRHKPCAAYTDDSNGYSATLDDQQDFVSGLLAAGLSSSSRATQFVISTAADLLQSIAPEGAPRQKIEASVKGALFLLILGLLKGVIDLVLLAGTVGLAVYVATQLFGWKAGALGQQQQQGSYAGASRASQQYQQQRGTPGHTAAAAAGYAGGAHSNQRWQQQQWPQTPREAWQRHQQDDVVDVFYGKQPPKNC